jgi:hypothetical protein
VISAQWFRRNLVNKNHKYRYISEDSKSNTGRKVSVGKESRLSVCHLDYGFTGFTPERKLTEDYHEEMAADTFKD